MVHHLEERSGHHDDSTSNIEDSISETLTSQGTNIGVIDGGDQFDGDDDNVLLAGPDLTDTDLTIELWAKPASAGSGSEYSGLGLLDQRRSTTYSNVHMRWETGNKFYFMVEHSPSGSDARAAIASPVGRYTYVVGTYYDSGDMNASIYINGTFQGSSTGSGTMSVESPVRLRIGYAQSVDKGTNYFFEGNICPATGIFFIF